MASQQPLALHHQNSHWYYNVCKGEDRSTSPSAKLELSSTRTSVAPIFSQPPAPDLFSSLLFNREVVYRDNSVLLHPGPTRPATTKSGKDEQYRSSLIDKRVGTEQSLVRSSMPRILKHSRADQVRRVSRGEKPGTRMTTKPKAKNKEDKSQKRSASHAIPRASELRNTRSKTRSNVACDTPLAKSTAAESMVLSNLSSDNDDNEDMQLEAEWRSTQNNDELMPLVSPTSKIIKTDVLAYLHDQTSQERLRQELEAAKSETESFRQLNAQLERELNDQRQGSHAVVKDRDQLRVEVELRISQHNELTANYESLQLRYEQAQTEHQTILKDAIKAQHREDDEYVRKVREQMETVKHEMALLVRDHDILKVAATFSPTPSSVASDQEKTENIRKTYVKVKRRYDHLHKAANDLSTCTRSIDLSCFGEFGQYLKQLRAALDEDSHERQAVLVREQSQDDN